MATMLKLTSNFKWNKKTEKRLLQALEDLYLEGAKRMMEVVKPKTGREVKGK